MKNRYISLQYVINILIIALLAVGFVGCASGSPEAEEPETSGSGSVDADGHVTIDFWYSLGGDSGKVVEDLVKKFNESQSEITVNATYQGNYGAIMAKVWGAISAGSTPNVAQLGAAPLLGETGTIAAVADYLSGENGMDGSLIKEVFWQYNTAKGTIWTMPFNNSVPVMYYNKDLFAAAGLDPEKPPKTWDEVIEYGKQLTKDTDSNGEIDQWAFNTNDDTHWYLSAMFLENGAQIVDEAETQVLYNSPEAVEMLTLWSDMITTHKIMPVNQHSEARGDFLAGKLGMLVDSSSGILSTERDAPFEVGVAVIPTVAGKDPVAPVGGASLVIFKHEQEAIQNASWEFVKFMASEESALYVAMNTGYLPTYNSARENPEFIKYMEEHPNLNATVLSLDYAYSIPEFSALGTSDTELRKAVQTVELGKASPQDALNAAKLAVDKFIKEQPQTQP